MFAISASLQRPLVPQSCQQPNRPHVCWGAQQAIPHSPNEEKSICKFETWYIMKCIKAGVKRVLWTSLDFTLYGVLLFLFDLCTGTTVTSAAIRAWKFFYPTMCLGPSVWHLFCLFQVAFCAPTLCQLWFMEIKVTRNFLLLTLLFPKEPGQSNLVCINVWL